MKILEPLFVDVLKKLNETKTSFMLIGGYAVNYYGYGRYTGDLDIWLNPDEGNKKHFLEALRLLNMHPEDIDRIRKCDFREAQVFSIGEPPLRIDFLTKVNLVSFEEALSHQKFFTIEDFSVAVIGYDHLILTKINTNRPKDKNDIEQLQQIHNPDRK
ncbi:MAG: nucleotidyltransferase [Bacteroidetes bacterium]|nr:hypothetical protein [Bacteroidia bacterium]MBX3106910.1 nucleotidyltransferase [Bacteroidota bacterium]MCO5288494.1 nucleotidyltransferase [Bacteroidota bacterium]MCW5932469.1 nucleotidyltransferase [Bacteroidota bacterium]